MEARGAVIVAFEGVDAAGKATQAARLARLARRQGLSAAVVSFPRYGRTLFSRAVADCLNGRFGSLAEVDPHFSALLFAGDRFESRPLLARLAESRDLLILNRYVSSNLAYQAARVPKRRRATFIRWLAQVEFGVYALPRPTLNVFLDVPIAVAAGLLARKGARSYTSSPADLFERDASYLRACRDVYGSLMASRRAGPWVRIPCASQDGALRDAGSIGADVWRAVASRLGRRALPSGDRPRHR